MDYIGFNLQVREFVAQTLGLDTQSLAFPLSIPDFFLQQYPSFYGHVVLGLQILQRRCRVPSLALVVVIGNFDISQLQLQSTIGFP